MPHEILLVGLDVGTTSIKAVVYRPDGTPVARGSVPTPTHYPQPGWAYFLADELWDCCVAVLREALANVPDPKAIAGIAVASVGESVVPIAADGTASGEVVSWFDTRTRPQAEWLDTVIGKDEIFRRTGLSLQPIFSLCKLLWFKEERPEAFARTVKWMMVADYIAWRLSGEAVTDLSLASRSLMMNLQSFEWDQDVLAAETPGDVVSDHHPFHGASERFGTLFLEPE
ncbi:MAG: L-fuculokinase, partial [Chloroflexota bacterium]